MDGRSSTATTRRPRVISIPVHFVQSQQTQSASALKIQKAFRGFLVRKSVKQIKTILKEVVEIERRIVEVKEVGRIDEKERLRLNETLMSLLLKLDSVRGICNGVRDCRKRVIKRAIALQEKLDSIPDAAAVGEVNVESIAAGEDFEPDPEEVAVEEEPKTIALVDGDCVVAEEEKKTILTKEEDGVDSISTTAASEIDAEQVAMVEEDEEPKTIHCLMEDVRAFPECGDDYDDGNGGKNREKDEGDEEMEMEKEKERKRCREYLLERMVEENEKLAGMMKELNEKNEIQMHLLNSLAQRVEMLEKTVVCDKLARMKKKKRRSGSNF